MSLKLIQQAHARISQYIIKTPLRRWTYLERELGFSAPIFLKVETFQNTGSFKVRGAANKILSLIEKGQTPKKVVAASAGNHAQGVSYMAGRLKIPATIVMPAGAPLVKLAATRDYGAEVVSHGSTYDEAYAKAQEILTSTPGAVYVHAYEDWDIIHGQGTLGLEVHEQLKEHGVTTNELQLVIPIGGGGLVSGVGLAFQELRPGSTVHGVVGVAAPGMAESLKAGKVVQVSPPSVKTLAEGLAVKKVSDFNFGILQKLVSEIAVVNDDEIAVAIATLMERGKIVSEGSGAAGVAAALAGKLEKLDKTKPVVFVLCGGNIDMNLVSNILERGLLKSGRWSKLAVLVEDRPGELARLATEIGQGGANIFEVQHDRIGQKTPLGKTLIRFQLETRDHQHIQQICVNLKSKGFKLLEDS